MYALVMRALRSGMHPMTCSNFKRELTSHAGAQQSGDACTCLSLDSYSEMCSPEYSYVFSTDAKLPRHLSFVLFIVVSALFVPLFVYTIRTIMATISY